jgi:hypothetical protein
MVITNKKEKYLFFIDLSTAIFVVLSGIITAFIYYKYMSILEIELRLTVALILISVASFAMYHIKNCFRKKILS